MFWYSGLLQAATNSDQLPSAHLKSIWCTESILMQMQNSLCFLLKFLLSCVLCSSQKSQQLLCPFISWNDDILAGSVISFTPPSAGDIRRCSARSMSGAGNRRIEYFSKKISSSSLPHALSQIKLYRHTDHLNLQSLRKIGPRPDSAVTHGISSIY